jgi:hypothetical protein
MIRLPACYLVFTITEQSFSAIILGPVTETCSGCATPKRYMPALQVKVYYNLRNMRWCSDHQALLTPAREKGVNEVDQNA